MNSRKLAGVSAASVGATTAVVALLLGTLSGSAGEEPTAKAFGLAAEGLLPISPTPFVEAPSDGHKALLEVPGPDRNGGRDGIYVGVLKVEAEHFRAKASAAKVDVLGLRLKLIEATCENGHGDSSIIGTDGEGKSSPYSGQALDISPVVKVEFNRQHRDHDKLTVDAAVVTLLPGDRHGQAISAKDLNLFRSLASKQLKVPTMDQLQAAHAKSSAPVGTPVTAGDLLSQLTLLNPGLITPKGDSEALEKIVISSATCREEEHHENRHEQGEQAPPPHPVEAHLPVTH